MGHLELQHYLPWSVSSICYVEVVILLFDQLHRVVESSGASACAVGEPGSAEYRVRLSRFGVVKLRARAIASSTEAETPAKAPRSSLE
jgi:hypothetical protein